MIRRSLTYGTSGCRVGQHWPYDGPPGNHDGRHRSWIKGFFRLFRGWLWASTSPLGVQDVCREGYSLFFACPPNHGHHPGSRGRQNTLRAKGPAICLAQAIGLGIRVPKRTKGPKARPFARLVPSQTYRSSISMSCFSRSWRDSCRKELVVMLILPPSVFVHLVLH
jgi:hypothetical protein